MKETGGKHDAWWFGYNLDYRIRLPEGIRGHCLVVVVGIFAGHYLANHDGAHCHLGGCVRSCRISQDEQMKKSIRGDFVVRWQEKDGTQHTKRYPDEAAARRAKQWLLDNGALSVDIAIRINDKTVGSLGDKENPARAAEIGQEGFWQNV